MGWGAKRATAPQPITVEPPAGSFADWVKNDDASAELFEKPEKLTDAAKAELAWHKLKSSKGWTEATVAMLLYEFIKDHGLFVDLVKSVRRH